MNNGWPEERDSLDTLYVPFVWVPDGAPEPTEWLAEHPDAFWVPATLVRGESSDGGLEAEPDSSDNDDAGYASQYPADAVDSLRTEALPSSAGGPDAAGSAAFAGSRYGQEDPVAAYLRINAVFSRLRDTPSAASGNASMALSNTSPAPAQQADAYIYSGDDPSISVAERGHDSGIRLAAVGDLHCEGFSGGCQTGGSFGATGAYSYRGRSLCAECISKALGLEGETAEERTYIMNLYLLKGR